MTPFRCSSDTDTPTQTNCKLVPGPTGGVPFNRLDSDIDDARCAASRLEKKAEAAQRRRRASVQRSQTYT
eukprot:scaffold5571_cov142-Isochrysis_galbana.AAC.3